MISPTMLLRKTLQLSTSTSGIQLYRVISTLRSLRYYFFSNVSNVGNDDNVDDVDNLDNVDNLEHVEKVDNLDNLSMPIVNQSQFETTQSIKRRRG